ncbi:MAG: prephenate dehydratase [Chloroflexota bacterium]
MSGRPRVVERPTVAFAGEPGAFAEDAVLAFFRDPEPVAVASFRDVFDAVAEGRVQAGVSPIENAVAGTIRETHDLLYAKYEAGVRVVGEVTVPVRLALLALPGQAIEDIDRVYSHQQALAQADEFLRTRPWTVMSAYNTAGAAKLIADRNERGSAAVASPRVANLYGLAVLVDRIEASDANRTRFAVIGRDGLADGVARSADRETGPRTTLVFAVRNVPGSLHRSLGAFAARGLNLSRLESRPWTDRGAGWEYVFWVDLDADPSTNAAAAEALDELAHETELVRILDTYPRAREG